VAPGFGGGNKSGERRRDDRSAEGAEWDGVWDGVSLPQPTRESGGGGASYKLPQWSRGGAPVENAFFDIFWVTEHFW